MNSSWYYQLVWSKLADIDMYEKSIELIREWIKYVDQILWIEEREKVLWWLKNELSRSMIRQYLDALEKNDSVLALTVLKQIWETIEDNEQYTFLAWLYGLLFWENDELSVSFYSVSWIENEFDTFLVHAWYYLLTQQYENFIDLLNSVDYSLKNRVEIVMLRRVLVHRLWNEKYATLYLDHLKNLMVLDWLKNDASSEDVLSYILKYFPRLSRMTTYTWIGNLFPEEVDGEK